MFASGMEQYATAHNDFWTLQEEVRLLKLGQFEQAERLSQQSERLGRLEKNRDIRSLWSTPSPFPAPLSSFSQPHRIDRAEGYNDFNEQEQNLVLSGLQLDEVDVPRRGASRANSVRFDDTATTNHWIHESDNSDYFAQRSNSFVGGYPMTERSSSHKSDHRSDGRQSSMRSYAGDTSSTGEAEGPLRSASHSDDAGETLHRPALTTLAGPAPAIIRCWFGSKTSFDPLLYAVVCTGSAKSLIHTSLVSRLGLAESVKCEDNESRIELRVFLPDAVVQHHGAAMVLPTKLPQMNVTFSVVPSRGTTFQSSDLGVFLGSDIISSHMGDVLFSQSKLFVTVDDGRKVCVPFIRPEAEETFMDLCTAHAGDTVSRQSPAGSVADDKEKNPRHELAGPNGLGSVDSNVPVSSPRPIQGNQASALRAVASAQSPILKPVTSPTEMNIDQPTRAKSSGSLKSFGVSFDDPRDHVDASTPSSDSIQVSKRGQGTNGGEHEGNRGRSFTNPTGSTPSSVWAARKASLSSSNLQKDTSTGPNSAGSRGRGMKVLRTSKSSSLSEGRQQSAGGAPEPPSESSGSNNRSSSTNTLQTGGRSLHVRTSSGGTISMRSSQGKPKSANVIGSGSAFKWMNGREM